MAKKNLHSLMSGIIGPDNNIDTPVETPNNPTTLPTNNQTTTKPRPGRPKKSLIKDEKRMTLAVSADLLRKVKYISLMDDRLLQDVVNEALLSYVAQWEEENHKIKMPKKQ